MTLSTGLDARELRLRASLLAHYELHWLGVEDEAGVLFPDSRRVRVESGMRHWCLDDSVRRSTVAGVGLGELRRVWSRLPERPGDARQWAIDQFVGAGAGVELDQLDVARLRAVGWLSRWLDLPHLPDQGAIDRALGLAALLEPLRALADDKFVGREDLLARLAEHLREPGAPLLIHGMGGAGKSAVVARHVLRHVPEALVCYLNFDNSALDPSVVDSLVAALAKQLMVQLPEHNSDLADLVRSAEERMRSGTKLLETSTRTIGLRLDEEGGLQAFADLARDRPTLVVLDTLEEVQRRPVPVQTRFNSFVQNLSASRISIVLAGRSPAPGFGYDSVELSVLPPDDAITLLRSLVDVPESEARRVVELIRATPLCVRLAAGILRKHPVDDAFRDLALRRTAIEGELYHRLLGYIDDHDVRKLAHPGLTLRRVTPELIGQVLAIPCQIPVPDDDRAHRLFRGLAREAMLVDRVPNREEVVHRADVRSIMLPRLAEDDPRTIASIHRRAVKYYAGRPDVTDRAEELYHRLMLAQTQATLDRYWDDRALPHLVSSLNDLPPSSKAYLAAKSPGLAVSDDDLRLAEREVRSKLLLRQVREFAASRKHVQALSTLDSHDMSLDVTPESTDLRIQLLDLLGQRADALDVAAAAQEEAARTSDTEEFFRLTAHILRLCELDGRLDDADTVAVNALQIAVNLPPTAPYLQRQLQLVVQRLRFARRGASVSDATAGQLRAQAISLHDRLGVRRVREVPGLLRELAAEVGEHSLPVLIEALRTEGIDPRDANLIREHFLHDSRVPDALLREMAEAQDRYTLAKVVVLALSWSRELPEGTLRLLTELMQQEADDAVTGSTDIEYTEQSDALIGDRLVKELKSAAAARDLARVETLLLQSFKASYDPVIYAEILAAVAHVMPDASERHPALEAVSIAIRSVRELGLAETAAKSGKMLEAVSHYDNAIATFEPAVQESGLSPRVLERVLIDRGVALIAIGRLSSAEHDFHRALKVADDEDSVVQAIAHQHLGHLATLRADLPTAIAFYRKAAAQLRLAEALLAAGLAVDAEEVLDPLMDQLRTSRAGHDLAIAEHRAAVAAFLRRDFKLASELARSANRRFSRRKDDRWAAISTLTRMRAELALGKLPTALRATALAGRLRGLGLTDEAAIAAALSVRASVRRGDLESAVDKVYALTGVGPRSPIECRMALRLCRAELAAGRNDHHGVLVEAEQGFAELKNHPDRLGSLDLPTGTAVEGLALAELAVSSAWQSDSEELFDWLEHTKADTYRYDPSPVSEPVTELRTAARRRQEAQFQGRASEYTDAELRRQLRDLPITWPMCTQEEVAAQLGDRALVSFGVVGDQHVALVVTADRTFRSVLGPAGGISALAEELRTILHTPYHWKTSFETLPRRAEQLDAMLFRPLSQHLDGRELVVLPTAELHLIPWGALPSLRGVPITVAPSATAWLRGERSASPTGRFVSVVTASGTFLHVLRAGIQLVDDDATPAAVLSALNGASVAHLSVPVSEGHGNSWFSAAELPSGPLFASAIRDLPEPPGIVVLDSHQQRFNGIPVGSDMFGFAGALLNAGVRTVVTTVGPVNDLMAVEAMEVFYRNLSAGRSVAQALAIATAEDPHRAPFVCLGADSTMQLR